MYRHLFGLSEPAVPDQVCIWADRLSEAPIDQPELDPKFFGPEVTLA
jgi:hypothetical protein